MINQQLNENQQDINEADDAQNKYGDVSLIQQQYKTNRFWTKVSQIDESTLGKTILMRGRIHNSRVIGKIAFLVLRENWSTIQGVLTKGESASLQMIKYIGGITLESVVDIEAIVVQPNFQIKIMVSQRFKIILTSNVCTQKVELQIKTIKVISIDKTINFYLKKIDYLFLEVLKNLLINSIIKKMLKIISFLLQINSQITYLNRRCFKKNS